MTFFPEIDIQKTKSNAKRKLREYPRWPSLASEVVGIYKQGDTVSFDSEGYANGYYWISYVGGLGMRNYLAIGQTDKDGNRISIWGKLN